jgi:hypothetical protein
MGRRFWLGVGILALFLVLGIEVSLGMDMIHGPAEQALEQAAEKALAGQMEEAVALARQAHDWWDDRWTLTASVADHSPMDEVDALFAEMEVYAKAQEDKHFAACCAQLGRLVESMAAAHRFNWWSLL